MQDDIQWTDEELAAAYRTRIALAGNSEELPYRVAQHKADAEVYRLARLGLAAEQVGRDTIERAIPFDQPPGPTADEQAVRGFLNHEAWRK